MIFLAVIFIHVISKTHVVNEPKNLSQRAQMPSIWPSQHFCIICTGNCTHWVDCISHLLFLERVLCRDSHNTWPTPSFVAHGLCTSQIGIVSDECVEWSMCGEVLVDWNSVRRESTMTTCGRILKIIVKKKNNGNLDYLLLSVKSCKTNYYILWHRYVFHWIFNW